MGERENPDYQEPDYSLGENPGSDAPGHRLFDIEEVKPFMSPSGPKPMGRLHNLITWAQENKKRVVVVSAIGSIIGAAGIAAVIVARRRMVENFTSRNPQSDITDNLKEQNQP